MHKILVIEDNRDVRENLSEILALSDYTVFQAENGKIGVELALNYAPDLILCDVMMPELDGFGVLHILSKNAKTADIPFVFLTAKAEKEDFRKGMTLGADDYIVKPFDDVQLLETIASRLNKSQRLRKSTLPGLSNSEGLVSESRAMSAIQVLADNREAREYAKKTVVFRENETPRWLYYVEKGEIKIFKSSEDGRELIVKIAGPGEFLGYLAILKEDNYPESATTIENSVLKLIPKDDFLHLVYGNRDVNARFLKMLANHVSEREQQLIELAYNSVRKRVANAILMLKREEKNEINYLREDMAAIAGTAKETLIRTLADFKHEKMIDVRDGAIVVLDLEKLRNLPN